MKTLPAVLLGLALLAAPVLGGDRRADRDRREDRDRDRREWVERPVVRFDVIRTRLVTEECERCGYRGEPGAGVFRIETRLYTEYLGGIKVRTWFDSEELFDHCSGSRRVSRWY